MCHILLTMAPLAELQMSHFFANVLSALVFGMVGIFLMILGYKAFDWITPSSMWKRNCRKTTTSPSRSSSRR